MMVTQTWCQCCWDELSLGRGMGVERDESWVDAEKGDGTGTAREAGETRRTGFSQLRVMNSGLLIVLLAGRVIWTAELWHARKHPGVSGAGRRAKMAGRERAEGQRRARRRLDSRLERERAHWRPWREEWEELGERDPPDDCWFTTSPYRCDTGPVSMSFCFSWMTSSIAAMVGRMSRRTRRRAGGRIVGSSGRGERMDGDVEAV